MMEKQNSKIEEHVGEVLELVAKKRTKHGEKYDRFLWTVAQFLRAEFPQNFDGMPENQLLNLIAFVDVIGEDSQGMMKRFKDACAGCGWYPCQWWNTKTGRCQIYNIRPQTCRIWPSVPNENGVRCLQPVAECAYAVKVTAVKVMESLQTMQTRIEG